MPSNSVSPSSFKKSISSSDIVTTISKINEPWCLHVAVVMCQCGLFYQAMTTETPALAPLLWVLVGTNLPQGGKNWILIGVICHTSWKIFGNSYWIHKRQDAQWKVFNPGKDEVLQASHYLNSKYPNKQVILKIRKMSA